MSKHEEFPELNQPAVAAVAAGYEANGVMTYTICSSDRKAYAAFLHEAMKQAEKGYPCDRWGSLEAIADSLHSPPPPPPTLAEAREAARQLAGPCAEVVHAFLSTLELKP